jgi:SAM-dependent methyltransferase
MKSPDYSGYAKLYAKSRPNYPEELFQYLASLTERHDVAWDCATGNGQAALSLVNYFEKVIATDISKEQIVNAAEHKRIKYKVCQAENSGIESGTVNLVTVASAVHWFRLNDFFTEVHRVIAPGCVIAVWTYHVGYIEPPFDNLFLSFYKEIISPYFADGAKLVDEKYSTIKLPGTLINNRNFFVSANWKLPDLLNFINSWSGTQEYRKAKGKNPVDHIDTELRKLWGDPEKYRTLQWPLFIKISRL